MLTIEEYISFRKREDNLKDFDLDTRAQNIRTCVNYVFDYFNNYITQHEDKAKTYMDKDKIEKYSSRLRDFSPDVKKWLVNLYSKHYNLLNFTLKQLLDKNEYFLLYHTEEEFENVTIECLSKLTRKYPYLRDEKDGTFLLVKDYHRIVNLVYYNDKIPKLPLHITKWINDTMSIYHVELRTFAAEWYRKVMFDETVSKPMIPGISVVPYDIKKEFLEKENLFNIDSLYNEIYTRPFITGKKQELLALIVYYWTYFLNDSNIWNNYLASVFYD